MGIDSHVIEMTKALQCLSIKTVAIFQLGPLIFLSRRKRQNFLLPTTLTSSHCLGMCGEIQLLFFLEKQVVPMERSYDTQSCRFTQPSR